MTGAKTISEPMLVADARKLSLIEKKKFLLSLSEADFRDLVVRPLFESLGLRFLRDTCGKDEEGKDCLFVEKTQLGESRLIAVQTKTGNLTMAGTDPKNSVNQAANQLDMALKATVYMDRPSHKAKPNQVILCASGLINDNARRYIHDEVKDNRIAIYDADWIIPRVDENIAELWLRINKDRFPYLRALRLRLLAHQDAIFLSTTDGNIQEPFLDEAYAPLNLLRISAREVKVTKSEEQDDNRYQKSKGKKSIPRQVTELRPRIQAVEATNLFNTREKAILVTGDGGSGKTTAVRRLAYKLAERALAMDRQIVIPVLIRALEFAKFSGTLEEYILLHCKELSGKDSLPFDDRELKNGSVAILIDALEEIADIRLIAEVLQKTELYHSKWPAVNIVITSRPTKNVLLDPSLTRYAKFEISELTVASAAKIVNRGIAGKKVRNVRPNEVVRQLQAIHGISLTPMLVTVFVATSDFYQRELPANITEVFKKYTELMLGRWDGTKGLARQHEYPFKDLLLRRVAFVMHSSGLTEVKLDEFRQVIREEISKRPFKEDAESVLDEVLYKSNLLTVEEGYVSFRHPLLREFFAGRCVSSWEEFKNHVDDDWWRRAMIFYFGDHPDSHADLMKLAKHADSLPLQNLFSAAVSIGLSAQACYFAETSEREASLRWVIGSLALSMQDYLAGDVSMSAYPMFALLNCYFLGKDAVASDILLSVMSDIIPVKRPPLFADDLLGLEQFWCIAGLIEAGELDAAESAIRKFNPEDERLLLAFDIGCFMIEHLKVSTTKEKGLAHNIRVRLAPKIVHLRDQMLKDITTGLLECSMGTTKELPAQALVEPTALPQAVSESTN